MIRILLIWAIFSCAANAATGDKLDRTGFIPRFDAEFNGSARLPLDTNVWTTKYYFSPLDVYPDGSKPSMLAKFAGRTIPGGPEDEVYVDQAYCGRTATLQINGLLIINAAKADPVAFKTCGQSRAHYLSGLITTQHSFSQVYGYFEMRAVLPRASGSWPAFWLLPTQKTVTNGGTLPEFDVMEHWSGPLTVISRGKPFVIDRTGLPISTLHFGVVGAAHSASDSSTVKGVDLSQFHVFGLLWTSAALVWYIDNREVFREAFSNADPHYMLINLAVDKRYPDTGGWPAQFMIDYVRAYSVPNP